MHRKKSKRLLVMSLVGLMVAGVCQASIVYSAPPNQSGGSDLNGYLEADDVTFATREQITQIKFWSFQVSAADYAGAIAWSIYANAAGLPGTSAASGLASPSGVATGNSAFGLNEFSYTFAVNVLLDPGAYWIGLHNGPADTIPATFIYWGWSADVGNSQSQDLAIGGQPWLSNFAELALEVQGTAVPEPGSMPLLALGLACLWFIRARQKHKQVLVVTVLAVALKAQTLDVLSPVATGVSDTLQNYSLQPPADPPDLGDDDGSDDGSRLYLPRPTGDKSTRAAVAAIATNAAVAAPPSQMVNQTSNATLPVTISSNYAGLGRGFNGTWTDQGLLPPDPIMGVGRTEILQWVNLRLTVLDKTTGLPLLGGAGFINANQMWGGLGAGSVCATKNQGDPQVQYDRIADRWVLAQFAFDIKNATASPFRSYPAAPYAFCIAVSQTSDATGAYNLYQYSLPNLPDYPKVGVWPDAYYVTDNAFSYSTTTGLASYVGSRVCAYNRTAMMTGGAANSICISGLPPNHFSMLAGDFEGTILPPTNETEFILSGDWFTLNNPPYSLQLRRFHPDFATPANSTLNDGLGGASDSFISLPFTSNVVGSCGDGGGACVPQPNTTRVLDSLSMRPMHRLAYRNLGANRETLVFTESVDPVGAAVAGIQLVEIRNPAANPPTIYNNVNFNPDTTNRWMGSAATDKLGNVALGYSVSSSTVFPGIRIAGRLRNDIRSFVRGEMVVQNGSGSQTASVGRWGDYSTMQIDPSDDCTFWYTTEYMSATSLADWATRIAGFKFNSCQ